MMTDDRHDSFRCRSGFSSPQDAGPTRPDRTAPLRTPLCDFLGCEVPILLAGMGGVARWELAAAVARAGGYPTLGMVREAPDLIEAEVTALRRATDRPFAVNLIPAATDPDLLRAQIDRCLALGVGAFSFFWDIVPDAVARVKAAGCLVLHQVGTLQAARDAEAAGADVLIAQGVEAGGHVHGRLGAFALAADLLRATHLPVVVSGGIADGRGWRRRLPWALLACSAEPCFWRRKRPSRTISTRHGSWRPGRRTRY